MGRTSSTDNREKSHVNFIHYTSLHCGLQVLKPFILFYFILFLLHWRLKHTHSTHTHVPISWDGVKILLFICFFYVNTCRRRLSTVLVKLKFAEHLKEAVTYIEQGHIRVGPETVTDPAFLVTRNMEDFVTWVDSSKIKRKVLEYNERLDDYDAMN